MSSRIDEAIAVATSPVVHASKEKTTPGADDTLLLHPASFDVLCGRDREAFNHNGNIHYRHVINKNRKKYQSTKSRRAKSRMTDDIIDFIRARGRFVKFDENTKVWYPLTNEEAHSKVAHALRSNKEPTVKQPREKTFSQKAWTKEEDDTTVVNPLYDDAPTNPNTRLIDIQAESPLEEFTMDFSVVDEIDKDSAFEVELFLLSASAQIMY